MGLTCQDVKTSMDGGSTARLSPVPVLNCPPSDVVYLSVQSESPMLSCCLLLHLMPLWRDSSAPSSL